MTTQGFSAAERELLAPARTSDEARTILEQKTESLTERQTKLLSTLSGFPGKNITGEVSEKLNTYVPRFMFFSHYDRMVGQIRLDTFSARQTGQVQPPIDTGEREFLDF